MQGLALVVGEVRGAQQQTNKEWAERLEKIQKPPPNISLSKPLSEPLSMAQGFNSAGTRPVWGTGCFDLVTVVSGVSRSRTHGKGNPIADCRAGQTNGRCLSPAKEAKGPCF